MTETLNTRPTTAILTDNELLDTLRRLAHRADADLADARARLADPASTVSYLTEWVLAEALIAETTRDICTAALAAADHDAAPRVQLASDIARYLGDTSRSTDPFANATREARATAARRMLRSVATEIDPALLVARLA